jgi:AraC-like DNA-binding protein
MSVAITDVSDRPEKGTGVDALADILSGSRVTSSIFCRSLLAPPWSVALDPEEHAGIFHFVLRGLCWIELPRENRTLRLVQGDIVLLPHGDAHVIGDVPGRTPVRLDDLLTGCELGPALAIRIGDDDPDTEILSGGYGLESAESDPIFRHLPAAIHVSASVGEAGGGIQTALRLLATEVGEQRSGYQAVVDRLVDMLLVYILRSWVESQPVEVQGWLRALRHPQIGEAVCLLHRDPARRWTVAGLARAVGMSRSAFAREFKELTGEAPLGYLTAWRMEHAAALLRRSSLSLAQIAEGIGYDSEYSFGKAFKRARQVSPGRYRARWAGES